MLGNTGRAKKRQSQVIAYAFVADGVRVEFDVRNGGIVRLTDEHTKREVSFSLATFDRICNAHQQMSSGKRWAEMEEPFTINRTWHYEDATA